MKISIKRVLFLLIFLLKINNESAMITAIIKWWQGMQNRNKSEQINNKLREEQEKINITKDKKKIKEINKKKEQSDSDQLKAKTKEKQKNIESMQQSNLSKSQIKGENYNKEEGNLWDLFNRFCEENINTVLGINLCEIILTINNIIDDNVKKYKNDEYENSNEKKQGQGCYSQRSEDIVNQSEKLILDEILKNDFNNFRAKYLNFIDKMIKFSQHEKSIDQSDFNFESGRRNNTDEAAKFFIEIYNLPEDFLITHRTDIHSSMLFLKHIYDFMRLDNKDEYLLVTGDYNDKDYNLKAGYCSILTSIVSLSLAAFKFWLIKNNQKINRNRIILTLGNHECSFFLLNYGYWCKNFNNHVEIINKLAYTYKLLMPIETILYSKEKKIFIRGGHSIASDYVLYKKQNYINLEEFKEHYNNILIEILHDGNINKIEKSVENNELNNKKENNRIYEKVIKDNTEHIKNGCSFGLICDPMLKELIGRPMITIDDAHLILKNKYNISDNIKIINLCGHTHIEETVKSITDLIQNLQVPEIQDVNKGNLFKDVFNGIEKEKYHEELQDKKQISIMSNIYSLTQMDKYLSAIYRKSLLEGSYDTFAVQINSTQKDQVKLISVFAPDINN